jgi:hypothetical protein
MELSPSQKPPVAQLFKNFPALEPTRSLLFSQEPSSSFYPKPDQSSPYHSKPVSLSSSLILSSHVSLGFPSGHFHSGFPFNPLFTVRTHYISIACLMIRSLDWWTCGSNVASSISSLLTMSVVQSWWIVCKRRVKQWGVTWLLAERKECISKSWS